MKNIGILTAGGDSPGLNAAIRALGKTVIRAGYSLVGFRDGFDGLAFDRFVPLEDGTCSGILTVGGTILRTSRNKPNKMPVGNEISDMTDTIVENYRKHQLECLVCIGGGGTHKSAMLLKKAGLNIVTMPKTIDNDVACTETSIGFDTALGVATNAIDSLHSTASSHKRIILVEVMGHNAGWLTLGSGLAGGADIILIPEIPYNIDSVAKALLQRSASGKLFSIMPIAEGALSVKDRAFVDKLQAKRSASKDKSERSKLKSEIEAFTINSSARTFALAQQLEAMTGLQTRVTILGYLQRGGSPSPSDRLLATRLGVGCAEAIFAGKFGMMVAAAGGETTKLVPIEDVAGKRKTVPADHPWLSAGRKLGVSFGE